MGNLSERVKGFSRLLFEPRVSGLLAGAMAVATLGLSLADVPFWPWVTGAGAGVLFLATVARSAAAGLRGHFDLFN